MQFSILFFSSSGDLKRQEDQAAAESALFATTRKIFEKFEVICNFVPHMNARVGSHRVKRSICMDAAMTFNFHAEQLMSAYK